MTEHDQTFCSRALTVSNERSYRYDPRRVQALYEQFDIDPQLYGDDPVYALFEYLDGSQLGADVFEDLDWGGQWPSKDEEYDPEA